MFLKAFLYTVSKRTMEKKNNVQLVVAKNDLLDESFPTECRSVIWLRLRYYSENTFF